MCTIEKYSSPIKNNADQGESQIKNEYNFGHLILNAKIFDRNKKKIIILNFHLNKNYLK